METKETVHPLIQNRWSPRSISEELISEKELFTLFEAARLAPSSYNNQPWRFIYAKRGSEAFDALFDLLVSFNKLWAKNASYLVLILSRTLFSHNGKLSKTHSFDTGSAWENLALQGSYQGLVIHGIEGFDYQKAQIVFKIPKHYAIESMIAIGKPAPKESLPVDLQKDEHKKERRPLKELISEGVFAFE